jgi:predicted dehydrogenase
MPAQSTPSLARIRGRNHLNHDDLGAPWSFREFRPLPHLLMATETRAPLRLGLIGCGNISNAYFRGLKPFPHLVEVAACADLDVPRAQAKAAEHQVARGGSVEELLADPTVDLILNLTIPGAHAEVNRQALAAGKHVYCEKPFALTYADGLKTLEAARAKGLRVGCAPDTVLGQGIQTCRRLIDAGAIGEPVAATANMMGHGPESWHPNPAFYYQVGGGPLFDMGPYYLTALVTMLGPMKSVSALARMSFAERLITSKPFHGTRVKVETPTHLCAAVEFRRGGIGTVSMSFDVWQHGAPMLEIYGTEGSIQCPDPNNFGGEVRLWTPKTDKWENVPVHQPEPIGRGLGVADFADALATGRPHRQGAELALHVVEVMESFHTSSDSGRRQELQSTCEQPAAMPPGIPFHAKLPSS